MDVAARRRLAARLLAVASCALAWSLLLVITGGFDTSVFGLPFTTHDSRRPAMAGALLLVAWAWAYGFRRVWAGFLASARATDRWLARQTLPDRALTIAIALAMAVFTWEWQSCVAGGSDSYGYLSQAQYWLHGVPIVDQPWVAGVPWPNGAYTFVPLGYKFVEGQTTIVPTYAVGLPILLSIIQRVAGYSAVFLTWPAAGAALVLSSYGMGRGLGSPRAGLISAWFVATNLTLIGEITSAMSDVPVAASLAVACYFLFRKAGPAPFRAGLAAAVSVLIRPNFAPTVAVLGLWLVLQPALGSRTSWTAALRRAVIFALASAPGFLGPALANWKLYGSPFLSGYGDLRHIYSWANLLPNLREYPALLISSSEELVLVGMIMLCVPIRRLWPAVEDRSVFVGTAAFVFSVVMQYLAFEPANNGGYLRYLLPCWPLLMVGAARLALLPARPGWRAALLGVIVVVYGVRSLVAADHAGAFDLRAERKYTLAAAIVHDHTDPNSVIFTMQHSGSVRYYAGRVTVRYDVFDPQWLDRAVDWMAAHGVHSYALLDDWEVKLFRERFPGQAHLAEIAAPAYIYQGAVATHFFDLTTPAAAQAPTVTVHDDFGGPRIVPPAPPAALVFSK